MFQKKIFAIINMGLCSPKPLPGQSSTFTGLYLELAFDVFKAVFSKNTMAAIF